ncbi:MAG: thioredoxin family protein [Patescibacteria group bacterium]
MLKKFKNFSLNFWLAAGIFLIILVGLIIGAVNFLRVNIVLNQKIAQTTEAKRPAEIEAIIIKEPSCADCVDVNNFLEQLKKNNVNVKIAKTVEKMSEEGNALIKKYNIEKIPTVILTGEIEKGEFLQKALPAAGEIKDGVFILKNIGGPFFSIAANEVKGRVKMVLLTDFTCPNCYDARVHESIVKQFGLSAKAEMMDRQSLVGKQLIAKYGITLVPTLILTGDLSAYPQLVKIWPQVGTVAKDGAYVFRQGVRGMGLYHDLSSNKIIDPAQAK